MMHSIMNRAGFNKEERRRAIYAPLEAGQHSFVYFKRYQSGFSEYYQAIGEDQRPILFCENQRGCIGCNYYISLTKEMDKNNPAYLGKLRGNAAGSLYQLYDNGLQPNSNLDRSKFRVNMAYIEYESNFLGMKGPRKLKAIVPNAKTLEDFDMYKFSEEETLDNLQGGPVVRLRNKQPRWNERLKSYALNFGGRVKQASIKNFILMEDRYDENSEEKAPNAIIFGKVDENTFSLEFRHPLSLYQAFGISMSEFDFKLKCE
jgi:tubby-related protein 1